MEDIELNYIEERVLGQLLHRAEDIPKVYRAVAERLQEDGVEITPEEVEELAATLDKEKKLGPHKLLIAEYALLHQIQEYRGVMAEIVEQINKRNKSKLTVKEVETGYRPAKGVLARLVTPGVTDHAK